MFIKYLSILFLIILLFNCGTKKIPIWVKDFGSRNFSKDGIEGIGFVKFDKKDPSTLAKARESAYNEAIKNLAIKLKTQIKGTVEHKMQDKISLIKNKYYQQTEEQIENFTNLIFDTVLGRKYFEEYIDKKNSLYWVYVWTTKIELQKSIEEEIEKQEKQNSMIIKISLENLKNLEEKIFSGNLIFLIYELEKIYTQLEEIKGIYIFEKIDNISLKFEIEKILNTIFSSVNLFSLKDIDNKEFVINQDLDLELEVKIQLTYKDRKIPVVNFPLNCIFLEGSGESEKLKYTDENGIAKFKVYKLNSKENKIEISPDKEILKKYINNTQIISNLKVFYILKAKNKKETKNIYIKIENLDKYKSEVLKNEVVSFLKNKEFNIIDDIDKADYVLIINTTVEDITDKVLSSSSKKTYLEVFSGNITVELKDLYGNKIVLSKSYSGLKGFGKTKKEAEQNTLKKLAEIISDYIIKNFY